MNQPPLGPVAVDYGAVATLTAAGTGTVTTQNLTNNWGAGCVVRFYCTAESGTSPTITISVLGFDPASGQYWTIGSSSAWTPASSTMFTLTLYPGQSAGSGNSLGVSAAIPQTIAIRYVIAGTTPSITGTIGVGTVL